MDWKNVVGSVAPVLGAALGGPLGGAAVSVIADALGLNESTEAAIKGALSGTTPEALLALKNAENDFAFKMQELGIHSVRDMEKLAVDDRDSARKREIAVGDHTARNLAYAITIGFFGILAALMVFEIVSNKEILYIMMGSLGSAWTGVIAYYFGSTAGSAKKTELLARSTPPVADSEGVTPPNPFAQ